MLFLLEFQFFESEDSRFYGSFKIILQSKTSQLALEKAKELIIEATENDHEFFESGTMIWIKSLKSIRNQNLANGIIFDSINSSLPEISHSYPTGSIEVEFSEGKKGNEVADAEPFFVIP